ncbi:Coproporphyrinogen III oxidase, partial [Polychytrium aggregatum]|uniref:Coproporphyrinogen III oxidase n=1 Tax=Polychytrium aggregatum TaxID=110093 RepID=UPI0022FF2C09
RMEAYVRNLQLQIVDALEALEGPDGGRFVRDHWKREEGGEGISCALQGGKVFEKAGVLVSAVHGPVPNGLRQHMNSRLGTSFGTGPLRMFATGVSLVIHPHNPLTPTSHANYRYIELVDENDKVVCSWFGGGSDLTPAYLIEEDAVHFHKVIKGACDQHDKSIYPKFKKWCDDYFNNVHRGEHRGIGGIFFDDVNVETMKGKSQEQIFAFVRSCGNSFVPQYIPIVQKRMNTEFTPEQKVWQQLRRGQYVEFNLVHDRGTKFGLATPGARIESILMSMPLTARWQYKVQPEAGSEEEKLLEVLRNPREWV